MRQLRKLAKIGAQAALLTLAFALGGCANMGLPQPFGNDPLTGGVDASQSLLLPIPIPLGLQRYPSHSGISGAGRKEGVETLRGYVDPAACATSFYNKLKQAGWQLRMYQRLGQRAVYVYQKDNEIACLVFKEQGALTIVEIWLGARLVDNAQLTFAQPYSASDIKARAGEEYGPITESQGAPLVEERWGLEEKSL